MNHLWNVFYQIKTFRWHFLGPLFLALISLVPTAAFSYTLSTLPDISSFFTRSEANGIVTAVGLGMDFHAYEPATPLGTSVGIDVGIAVTAARPPNSLASALSAIANTSNTLSTGGSSSISTSSASAPTVPIVPSARISLHKGITKYLDVGVSYLPITAAVPYVGGSSFLGFDVKYCFYQPEEGPAWAFRVSYNLNTIKAQDAGAEVLINTTTITPQLLMSKKMSFADPYIGMGYQYTFGNVSVSIPIPNPPPPDPVVAPVTFAQNGSGGGGVFFAGLKAIVPVILLRLTLEGGYSTAGVDYLGTKLGLNF